MFPELVGMLRNRSRSVASKQAIVPDHSTQTKASQNQNQNQSQTTPISSVFFTGSSRLCNGILARSIFDAMVPRSILNNNKLSNFFNNTFLANENNITRTPIVSAMNKPTTTYYKMDSEAVGLAIIDSIKEGNTNICKPNRKMVLYGAKLKVQVPLHVDDDNSAFSLSKSKSPPKSPAEFGIKNRNSQMFSHFCSFGSIKQLETTDEKLSLTEMELSEDYTCVITHGPNPRTTHIFDDCIVDSCSCDPVLLPHAKNKHCSGSSPISPENHTNSLSFCITCKNKLRQGEDIYMYRGEKAFCSDECRSQEMLSEGYDD